MRKSRSSGLDAVVDRLVDTGGRAAQDLGLGRILGQILVYLYLCEDERSLDEIERRLGLSKASVSTSARQLESLGLLVRVWRSGDRRSYYRTADDLATALRQGLLRSIETRLRSVGGELALAEEVLGRSGRTAERARRDFLRSRVKRANSLCDYAGQMLGSPVLKLLGKLPGLRSGRRARK